MFKEEAVLNFFRLTLWVMKFRLKSAYSHQGRICEKDESRKYFRNSRALAGLGLKVWSGVWEAVLGKVKRNASLGDLSNMRSLLKDPEIWIDYFWKKLRIRTRIKNFMEFVNPNSLKIISKAYFGAILGRSWDEWIIFSFFTLGLFHSG